MSAVSKRILALIDNNKITYGELSKRTNIPKSALQRYAVGETQKIPLDRLVLLAEALETTSEYLMGWKSEKHDIIQELKLKNKENANLNLTNIPERTKILLDGKELTQKEIELVINYMRFIRERK